MHSALFVAKPESPSDWNRFIGDIKPKLAQGKGVLRLAENIWLVNFQDSVTSLSWLIARADALGVSYGILPFKDEPQWLPVGLDPKTISDRSEDG